MKLFIATDARVYIVNNRYYAHGPMCRILERYYKSFGSIILCTRFRKRKIDELPQGYEDVTHMIEDIVSVGTLEDAVLGKCDAEIKRKIQGCQLLVARVPSVVSSRAAYIAKKLEIPVLAEVIGCTWDAYWNYSLKGKFLALPSFLLMRNTVKKANYATYVTEHFLQRRYPCKCSSINCSNVAIDCSDKSVLDRRLKKIADQTDKKKIVLFTAAAIDVAYKGQEYVIRALKILSEKNINIEYRLAGGGDPTRLKKIAEKCGVVEQVIFLGSLSRSGVISELDNADIYVQPSLQEGLPRSVIEAMSRGCPSLGARTAGIPELIDSECIFKRANPEDTARAIEMMINSNMAEYSKRNYEKALEYDNTVLTKRRNDYYQKIITDLS